MSALCQKQTSVGDGHRPGKISDLFNQTPKRHIRRPGHAGQPYHRSCTSTAVELSGCDGSLR